MRVGIDGRAMTGRFTGDRTYWLNLVRAHALAAQESGIEYVVYSRLPFPDDCVAQSKWLTLRTIPATNDRLWTLVSFPRALRQDGIDIAHTQYTTPLRSPCPVVTTVHDISFRLYPEWFPRKHRILLNVTVPSAMRRATAVITDSESSRRDIERVYRLPEGRVSAIPLAAAPMYRPMPEETARSRVSARFGIEGPFAVSVGVLQPRKNLPLLVEALACAVQSADIPHRLILAGKRGWGYEGLYVQAARLRVAERLLLTDYVSDDDLPALYSAADMMLFPSLYEGFGLPPLEAMACGAPTLVSDAPAMPEVAGDGAIVLPVIDARAWADAITHLAQSPTARTEWGSRGMRRAALFTWEATAEATRRVYRSVVAGPCASASPEAP